MAGETLIRIRQERLDKVKKLREMGIDPYPSKSHKNIANKELIDNYSNLENKEFIVAGRLMSFREHGALAFGHLQDESGKIQLYIKQDTINPTNTQNSWIGFEDLKLIDVGDFVEAKGILTKTQKGEISILVKELKIISKSLRPLPDKWEGLKNKEERYRRRYLEFALNSEIRERFKRKAKFFDVNRKFLERHGFIEVETPILEHFTGGADARPFITHHNDLNHDFYLRISSELFQKRLIGGGFEKVFTLGPNFRNEGLSDEHLQEYYQIEWYWAYADYNDNMNMLKEMFKEIALEVWGTTKFSTRDHTFDLADEWTYIDYPVVIKEKLGVDIFEDSEEKMESILNSKGVKLDGSVNRNRLIDNLWKVIRKTISGPAFLINEPKFMSPLAKSRKEDLRLTERFHIVIAGSELGNGYSEINDATDQLERFLEQQKLRESGDDEAQMLDIDYVEMLEYGMPPVSGYAHSERLFWFLENVTAREGTLFPLMKHEIDDVTVAVYSDIKKYIGVKEDYKPKVELDPNIKFVVGKAVSVEKHPNADKLFVCKVDVGTGKELQILTGADNVKVGSLVPVALPGAVIPNKVDDKGKNIVIKKSKIRGELSEGMMCSKNELGKGEDAEGIWILDDSYSDRIGQEFKF